MPPNSPLTLPVPPEPTALAEGQPRRRGALSVTACLIGLCVLYVAYAGVFIWRTSVVVDGQRYFTLFDDGMISMTYARTLARGAGAVWYPGAPRVEGYTNPLWVATMALLHLLPVGGAQISLLVQLLGAACMLGTILLTFAVARRCCPGSSVLPLAAAFLTASYLPLNNWALQGMEVGPLALLTTLAVWLALRGLQVGSRVSLWLYPVLGLAILLRMDAAVSYVVIWVWCAIMDRQHRRQHLWLGGLILSVALGALTAVRLSYYHSLLPNTYYLKVTGTSLATRALRGAMAAGLAMLRANAIAVILPYVFFLRRPRSPLGLAAVLTVAVGAYSVSVGGDAWEWWGGANRYVCPVMPLFFVLLAATVAQVMRYKEPWRARPELRLPALPKVRARWLGAAILVGLCLNLNAVYGFAAWSELTLQARPLDVESLHCHIRQALALRELTTPQALVAVVWAGAQPYFLDRPCIDLLGKSDPVIAHGPSRPIERWLGLPTFRPGHSKWDYAYSIGTLKPDVVVELWMHPQEAQPYLGAYDVLDLGDRGSVWIRHGSPNLRWDRLAKLKTQAGRPACFAPRP